VHDTLGPYNGTLNLVMTVRLTDNTCTGSTTCTLPDLPVTVAVPCGSASPSGLRAGRCFVSTTISTLFPGTLAFGDGIVVGMSQAALEGGSVRAFEGGLFLP
jgi:hypothetical protein